MCGVNFNEVDLISQSAYVNHHPRTVESLTSDFLAAVYGCDECIFDMLNVVF